VNPLQATTKLLEFVDAVETYGFPFDYRLNEARQAIAVLMGEHAPPVCEYPAFIEVNGALCSMASEEWMKRYSADPPWDRGRMQRTANGAGGLSSGTPDGQKERDIKL